MYSSTELNHNGRTQWNCTKCGSANIEPISLPVALPNRCSSCGSLWEQSARFDAQSPGSSLWVQGNLRLNDSNSKTKKCPTCTYLNPIDALQCEICCHVFMKCTLDYGPPKTWAQDTTNQAIFTPQSCSPGMWDKTDEEEDEFGEFTGPPIELTHSSPSGSSLPSTYVKPNSSDTSSSNTHASERFFSHNGLNNNNTSMLSGSMQGSVSSCDPSLCIVFEKLTSTKSDPSEPVALPRDANQDYDFLELHSLMLNNQQATMFPNVASQDCFGTRKSQQQEEGCKPLAINVDELFRPYTDGTSVPSVCNTPVLSTVEPTQQSGLGKGVITEEFVDPTANHQKQSACTVREAVESNCPTSRTSSDGIRNIPSHDKMSAESIQSQHDAYTDVVKHVESCVDVSMSDIAMVLREALRSAVQEDSLRSALAEARVVDDRLEEALELRNRLRNSVAAAKGLHTWCTLWREHPEIVTYRNAFHPEAYESVSIRLLMFCLTELKHAALILCTCPLTLHKNPMESSSLLESFPLSTWREVREKNVIVCRSNLSCRGFLVGLAQVHSIAKSILFSRCVSERVDDAAYYKAAKVSWSCLDGLLDPFWNILHAFSSMAGVSSDGGVESETAAPQADKASSSTQPHCALSGLRLVSHDDQCVWNDQVVHTSVVAILTNHLS